MWKWENILSVTNLTSNLIHPFGQLVFIHTIRPILNTVRMHPLLVTHSRDLEKTSNRWKKMEFHDVLVESSRYSLISQESSKEEEMQSILDLEEYGAKTSLETPGILLI